MANCLPGVVTIGEIIRLAAYETDQPDPFAPGTDPNVPLEVFRKFVNRSYRDFIANLVLLYNDFFVNPDNKNPYFITTNGNYLYPLPNDFDQLLGVQWWQTPNQPWTAMPLRSFMKTEEGLGGYMGAQVNGGAYLRYRLTGNQIGIEPRNAQTGLQLLVQYVPIQLNLRESGNIGLSGVQAGETLQVACGPSVNLPASAGGLFGGNPVATYTAVTGTPASPGQFQIGSTDVDTALNLAAAMNAYPPWAAPFSGSVPPQVLVKGAALANGPVVTLMPEDPQCIVWTTANAAATGFSTSMVLDPYPVPSQYNPFGAWTNFCSVLNGLDEYIVADVDCKVCRKQQQLQDIAGFEVKKQEVLARLKQQYQNRDAAMPKRIQDVSRLSTQWQGAPFFPGGGW